MLKECGATFAEFWRDFGQPDGCLGSLDLAEEGADVLELMMPPMLEQAGRFGRDKPLVRIGERPPGVDKTTKLVDYWSWVIFLFSGREDIIRAESHFRLCCGRFLALFRFWNRCDQVGVATGIDDDIVRLAIVVQVPVAWRIFVGRIQNWFFKEFLRHAENGAPHTEITW